MKIKLFVLLAVITVLSIVSILALADSDEDDADGIWCYTPGTLDFLSIADYPGEKAFATVAETGVWTGTFTGNSKEYGFVVFQGEMPRLFIATVWFDTVEVGGASGGLEMEIAGDLMPSLPETASYSGRWVITGGTGELENLRGEGAWWGPGFNPEKPDECGVMYYSVEDLDGLDFDDDDDDDDDDD